MDDTASDPGASGPRPGVDRTDGPDDAPTADAARRPDAAGAPRASRSGRPTRPTLAAVARAAGVAPSTASLAFSGTGPVSEDTRQRILAVAAELGYDGPDPRARSLRRGRSGVIGVVLDDRLSDAFRDPVNVLTLDGIAEVAGAAGVSLLLVRSPLDDERGMAPLVDAPMDAVILIGCNVRIDPAVAVLRRRSIPVVAIEADAIEGAVPVHLDNRDASRRAAAFLHDLGHRQVTVVTLPLDSARERGPVSAERERASSAFTTTERLRGVRDVYPDAPAIASAGSSVEEGRIAGAALFTPGVEPPTAVVAQSDLLAVGVISAALDAGLRVPEDVSVVGFDGIHVDDSLLYRSPIRQLTTLVQPFVPKGEAAARAALAMLEGESPEPASFRSELRIGDTTGPPSVRPRD
ncbi:LacI family DNA-binding transcriptional regulator [Curtobacterium sp. MCPF17_050]|uniref:LacI family DNA-binding transcriptional regulator n=1 Tax=Curtobacterium sp. MCPF17_050 TaxID=2175664 RepID=UPI000D9AD87B|nr:LacI family DNA-binding transcriptional regulator [Curtobacterium sp. MCPF17_050]WIB15593.1 LacI family DNA-binding transcriptional regulator [Curtobacterium sp. MCPF17_050]